MLAPPSAPTPQPSRDAELLGNDLVPACTGNDEFTVPRDGRGGGFAVREGPIQFLKIAGKLQKIAGKLREIAEKCVEIGVM